MFHIFLHSTAFFRFAFFFGFCALATRDTKTIAEILATMYATGRTQIGILERGLTLLEIIASISPLIGLLGTVLGMVTVFNAISAGGIGNPQVLSDGISKALITTVAGLSVAIPALGFHSWLSRRVDEFATEMQDRATGFIAKLYGSSES